MPKAAPSTTTGTVAAVSMVLSIRCRFLAGEQDEYSVFVTHAAPADKIQFAEAAAYDRCRDQVSRLRDTWSRIFNFAIFAQPHGTAASLVKDPVA